MGLAGGSRKHGGLKLGEYHHRWKGSVKHVRQSRQNAQTKAVHNAFPQARAYKQRSRVNYVIVMNNKEAIGGYPGRSSCRLAFVTYLTYL